MEKDEIQFKKIYSKLKPPKNCPGINWRHGSSDGDFDVELLPLLKKLNSLGYCHTTGSCAGHSVSEIKKGKDFSDIPYKLTITIHVKADRINDFEKVTFSMCNASSSRFWCELGYDDDYNCKTEKGFIPFRITVFCRTKKSRDRLLGKYEKILDEALKVMDISDFIHDLASSESLENVCNQYDFDVDKNTIRRENLLLYLEQMKALVPSILFVGEAPGYLGARLTGIPFTSEKILLDHDIYFGRQNGFWMTSKDSHKENTATFFWDLMKEINIYPLVWNAFPYHPFQEGNPQSNRSPSKSELNLGQFFLKQLVEMYKIKKIIAVGKKADTVLEKMGLEHLTCRHPSRGGNRIFRKQVLDIFS